MLPPQSVAAVKGLHQNELILRYSGLTRAELALGAARLKAAMRRIDRQMYLMKYKNPTVAGQQPPWGFGAPEGTRTHTLKAREPKSRMSTNSITGANRKRRCWPPLKSLYFDTGRFPRRSKTLYPHTVTDGVFILPQPSPLGKWANATAAQNFLSRTN